MEGLAHILCGIGDAQAESAGGCIGLGGGNGIAAVFCEQLEDKFVIPVPLPAGQGLFTGQLNGGSAADGIDVDEGNRLFHAVLVGDGGLGAQGAVQVVSDLYVDPVDSSVIGDAVDGLAAVPLRDQVVVITGLGEGNALKADLAVDVLHGLQGVAHSPCGIGLDQVEGEGVVFQSFSGQLLGAAQGHGGSAGLVLVDKVQGGGGGVFHSGLCTDGAVAIVNNLHGDRILCRAVGDTVDGLACVLLLQHIVEGLAHILCGIGDAQAESAGGCIGLGGGNGIAAVFCEQLEDKFVIPVPLPAGQGLFTGQLNGGSAADGIDVDEGNRLFHAVLVGDGGLGAQGAVQVVSDLYVDPVDSSVIGDAVDGLAAVPLRDQVVVITGLGEGNALKADLAVDVLHGLQGVAHSPCGIGLDQVEGEGVVFQSFSGQLLGAAQGHGGSAGLVLVDKVQGGGGGVLHSDRSHDAALVIVFHNHCNVILDLAVGHAVDGLACVLLFQHIVEGLAHILCGVVQLQLIPVGIGIHIRSKVRRFRRIEVFISRIKLEAEPVAVQELSAVQDLFAGEGNRPVSGDLIDIHEENLILRDSCAVIDMDLGMKLALQIVGNLDPHPVDRVVIGDAVNGLAAVLLHNEEVLIFLGIEVDLGKGDDAASTVGHGLPQAQAFPRCVGIVQLKLEFATGQGIVDLSGQLLFAGELSGSALGNIIIDKGQRAGGIAVHQRQGFGGNIQLAQAVVLNHHGHLVLGFVVDDTVGAAAVGNPLRNAVGIRTCLGIGDRREGECAVGKIPDRPAGRICNLRTVHRQLRQDEGELVVQQGPAPEGLGAVDNMVNRICRVAIAEGDGIAGCVDQHIGCLQLAIHICHVHGNTVGGLVGNDAVAVSGGFHNIEEVGAHLIELQGAVESDLPLRVVGAGQQGNGRIVNGTNLEAEFVRAHRSAGQRLADKVNGKLRILRIVGIGEGCSNGSARIRRLLAAGKDHRREGAVAVVDHPHGDRDLLIAVGPAIGNGIRLDLSENIGKGLAHIRRTVIQDESGEATLGGGQQLTHLHAGGSIKQAEGEPSQGLGSTAIIVDGLVDIHGHSGRAGGGIGVGEACEHIPSGSGLYHFRGVRPVSSHFGDLQLAIHITVGHHNSEGVDGLIVADTTQGCCRLDLDDPVIIGADFRVALVLERIGELEAGAAGHSLNGLTQLLPGAVGQQLLQLELEAVIHVPIPAKEGLVTGNMDKYGVNLGCLVVIDHDDRNGGILCHGHIAVTGQTVVPVGGREAGIRVDLHHHGSGSRRQAEDLKLLIVLQGNCKLAVFVSGDLGVGTVSMLRLEGGIGSADAAEGHLHGKLPVGGNLILSAEIMLHFLGNGQIAGASVGVDKVHIQNSVIDNGQCAGGGKAGGSGHVFHGLMFRDAEGLVGSHAADVEHITGIQLHLGNAFGELHGSVRLRAVRPDQPCGILGAVGRIGEIGQGKGEGPAGCRSTCGHGLCQADTGFGLYGKLAVIAQSSTHVELIAGIIDGMVMGVHEGNAGLAQGFGQIVTLVNSVAIHIDMNIALGDIPGAVCISNSGCLCRIGQGTVDGLRAEAAVVLVDLVGPVYGAGGLGLTGIEGAVCIGIDRCVFQIVVLLILSGGIEIAVGIDSAVAGGICVIPLVGVEVDGAVRIQILRVCQVVGRYGFQQIEGMDLRIQGHLVNQADGMLRAVHCQVGQLAVLIQGHIVADHRDQGSRDGEGHQLLAGGNIIPNLNGGVHHIGFADAVALIYSPQIAIGLNQEGRIRGSIAGGRRQHRHTLVIEAQELTGRIGVPADVVGVVVGIGVAELAVLVGQAYEGPGGIVAVQTQSGPDRDNHLRAQGSGCIKGAQLTAAGDKVAGQIGAGEQLIVNENALDIGHFHVLADAVHKRNVAGQVFTLGNQCGEVAGLQLNGVDDVLESLLQVFCQTSVSAIGGKVLIHIIFFQSGGDLCDRSCGRSSGSRLNCQGIIIGGCIGNVQGLIAGPEIAQGSAGIGVGRIQHADGNAVIAQAQTQGIEQAVTAVLFLDLRLGIRCAELADEAQGRTGGSAVAQLDGVRVSEDGAAHRGRAVGHQNQDGLAVQLAHDRIRHRDGIGRRSELIHSQDDALLDVGAAHHFLCLCGGTLALGLRPDICVQCHRLRGGWISSAGGHHIVIKVLAIAAGGVAIQRQDQDGIAGSSGTALGGRAGIEDYAHPVVLVGSQQRCDALVGRLHQFLRHIIVAGVVIHGAADIQHQHGVCGNVGHTGNAHGCRHSGQSHQEAVGIILGNARTGKG